MEDHQLRLLPSVPEKLGSRIIPQTVLPYPRNGEPPSSAASDLCFILQILSPAPSSSRVYPFTVLSLPSFSFPIYTSAVVRTKLILHSSFPQMCTRACWKRLCREPGARIQHSSTAPCSSETSLPALQSVVLMRSPCGEARTRCLH